MYIANLRKGVYAVTKILLGRWQKIRTELEKGIRVEEFSRRLRLGGGDMSFVLRVRHWRIWRLDIVVLSVPGYIYCNISTTGFPFFLVSDSLFYSSCTLFTGAQVAFAFYFSLYRCLRRDNYINSP